MKPGVGVSLRRPAFVQIPISCAALLTAFACSPPRPARMSELPQDVEVVHIPLSQDQAEVYRFPAGGGRGVREFEFAFPGFLEQPGGELHCRREISPSRLCPRLELSCADSGGENSFELELRKDGQLRVRLGPPWETAPQDLVETGLYIESRPEGEKLPGLDGELVEGIVDAASLELRAQPGRVSSPWFNRLSVHEGEIFVAIHESHPHAAQVMATLSLVGRIWAANASSFESCGFSGA